MKEHEDFSDEVLFQVGQRVHVDLSLVPPEERETTTGVITSISTTMFTVPKFRRIRYKIRFDGKGNYIKKEFRLTGAGIKSEITCGSNSLRSI